MKKILLLTISLLIMVCSSYGCDTSQEISDSSYISSDIDNSSLIPDISQSDNKDTSSDNTSDISSEYIDLPIGEPIEEQQYGEYSFGSEHNGKSIVTIYNPEQIADFQQRRNDGEFFSCSTETILYLIEDTKELFQQYDIIRIRDINGNLNIFYGESFILSEEYMNSFNGFDIGNTEASYDLRRDLLIAIFTRIEVLNSAVFESKQSSGMIMLTDVNSLTDAEIKKIQNAHLNLYLLNGNSDSDKQFLSQYSIDLFHFDIRNEKLQYIDDISKTSNAVVTELYTEEFVPEKAGQYKYDDEDSIIIELWEEQTNSIIARIRYDKNSSPEIFAEIEKRVNQSKFSGAGAEKYVKDYRVVVFGITLQDYSPNKPFMYFPDGDINQFSYVSGCEIYDFKEDFLFMQGCGTLTEYINELLANELS